MEIDLHSSKKVVYLDATFNPLLVSSMKKFGDTERNRWRKIMGVVVVGRSNHIIALLLHHVPERIDLSNEDTFAELTLYITEQVYNLFQGNSKISVRTFPNQEIVIEVLTPELMIPSYHNAYFKSNLSQPHIELVNATNAAKIANGCTRILIIVEEAISDCSSIDILERSAVPLTSMNNQLRNAVQIPARAVHFNNGYFPIAVRLNIKYNARQLQSNTLVLTSIYSMPCPQNIVQQIRDIAPIGLQETDKYDRKKLISDKNTAIEIEEVEDTIAATSNKEMKLNMELTEEDNNMLVFLKEQHRMANPGKKFEPIVADEKLEDLLFENNSNIFPTSDDKKTESSEKIDHQQLNVPLPSNEILDGFCYALLGLLTSYMIELIWSITKIILKTK